MTKSKLRLWMLLFFLALAIPTAALILRSYSELKWEALHQQRLLAEELAIRIDDAFTALINREEAQTFHDYQFNTFEDTATALPRSPLAALPPKSGFPGLIGYFQVDAVGGFSTPHVPVDLAGQPDDANRMGRQALQQRLLSILQENRLVERGNGTISKLKGSPVPDRVQSELRLYDDAGMDAPGIPAEGKGDEARPGASTAPMLSRRDPASNLAQSAFDQLGLQGSAPQQKNKSTQYGSLRDLKLDDTYVSVTKDSLAAVSPVQGFLEKKRIASKESQREQLKQERHLRTVIEEERSARQRRETRSTVASLASEAASEADHDRLAMSVDEKTALDRGNRIHTFESEIDSFDLRLLDSGHFVLFRKVWRNDQRYIQGALIQPEPFLQGVIESIYEISPLARSGSLLVAYQADVFTAFHPQEDSRKVSAAGELTGALLLQRGLSAPLGDLQLLFSVNQLAAPTGSGIIHWLSLMLIIVLCGGFLLMYRMALRQLELARQQQDFVSAVSHELKTPLTSIRLYAEMLREGWTSREKQNSYYDFIFFESERLSRLINNVLQLARLSHNHVSVELNPVQVSELMDSLGSKISNQIERAGFQLHLNCDPEANESSIQVDRDYFTQIMINLVDNALKFSKQADHKQIDINCNRLRDGSIQFSVRDYGPGIGSGQMKKIFRLFYRTENELTRETVGTGIGLALVNQLAQGMNGRVDVVNLKPGAEFRLRFPMS